MSFRSVFCVIPSEAEGPRIFLDASRHTSNHESAAAVTLELHSDFCVIKSEAKNPGSLLAALLVNRSRKPELLSLLSRLSLDSGKEAS
jgi:hypothetical protein